MDKIYEQTYLDKWEEELSREKNIYNINDLQLSVASQHEVRDFINLFQGEALDIDDLDKAKAILQNHLNRLNLETKRCNIGKNGLEDSLLLRVKIKILEQLSLGEVINYTQIYTECKLELNQYIDNIIEGVKFRLELIIE